MATIDVRRFTDLDDARKHYLCEIDSAALAALAAVSRPELEAVHTAKARDAKHGAGPWLDAECAATGLDPDSAARRILGARDRYQSAAITIEQARITAKETVRQSTLPRDMHRALTAFQEACNGSTN